MQHSSNINKCDLEHTLISIIFLSIYFLINLLFHIDMSFILFFMISLSCCRVCFFIIVNIFLKGTFTLGDIEIVFLGKYN